MLLLPLSALRGVLALLVVVTADVGGLRHRGGRSVIAHVLHVLVVVQLGRRDRRHHVVGAALVHRVLAAVNLLLIVR